MAGTCEYGNETSGSVKWREFDRELVSYSRRTLPHGVSNKLSK